jgi:hypothetical protein
LPAEPTREDLAFEWTLSETDCRMPELMVE